MGRVTGAGEGAGKDYKAGEQEEANGALRAGGEGFPGVSPGKTSASWLSRAAHISLCPSTARQIKLPRICEIH